MYDRGDLGLLLLILCVTATSVLSGCREEEPQERVGVLVDEGNMLGVDYEWRGVQSSFEATVKQIDREHEKTHDGDDVVVFKGKGIGVVVVGPHWASLKGDFPAAILYLQGADNAVQNILELWSGKTIEGPSRPSPVGKGIAEPPDPPDGEDAAGDL